jgi:membrane protein implicated in regulation of membrane protease activity
MQKDIFLLILGLLVFVTPFLGVPESWKAIVLFVLGAGVAILAILYRLQTRRTEQNEEALLYEEREPTPDTTPVAYSDEEAHIRH